MTQSQAALTASDALKSSVTSTASKLTITQYQILITGKCPAGAEVSALKWSPDSVWRQQIVKWYKLIEICSRCCNKRCVRSDALRSSGWRCCVAGEDSAPSSPPCSLTLLTKLSGSQSQKSLHASLGSCVRRQPIGWAGPGTGAGSWDRPSDSVWVPGRTSRSFREGEPCTTAKMPNKTKKEKVSGRSGAASWIMVDSDSSDWPWSSRYSADGDCRRYILSSSG